METKNNDFLNKQKKKFKKKPRKKTKKKENLKALKGAFKCMDQLFSEFCKPNVRENPGRLRAKGKQGVEGMFFKGLRSEYVTRDHLNEGNEARKNEDTNRIIDLGRVFQHRKQRLGRPLKRNSVCSNNLKPEISPGCFRNISDDSNENLEQCHLSPISFAFALEESCYEDLNFKKIKSKKLDLEKEFATFVSKYEETVATHVLYKLPEIGVLEDAVEALRKIRERRLTDSKKDESRATECIEQFNFLTPNFEPEVLGGEGFVDNFVFSENFLVPKKSLYNYENFMEKPVENLLILTDVESENFNHSSFMPVFDNDCEIEKLKVDGLPKKVFEKPVKDLSIASPPIQFYRRNMF